jgi:hypothetical protein
MLKYVEPLSKFAFKFNFRRYIVAGRLREDAIVRRLKLNP